MAIISGMLAILGHFSRFSSDDHLEICFSDQQDFTESTLVLYVMRYSVLCFDVSNLPGPFNVSVQDTENKDILTVFDRVHDFS